MMRLIGWWLEMFFLVAIIVILVSFLVALWHGAHHR